MCVTHWNDSSKTKNVAVASACLFGDTYEATIGRKLKAKDVKNRPRITFASLVHFAH